MIQATMKIEATYTSPSLVVATLFKSNIKDVEDAGAGMYNLYISLIGIECIVQSYPYQEDTDCYILFTNMNEDDDTEYCKLNELPEALQWGIAMEVAKHFGAELKVPYFDYSGDTFHE